MTNTTEQLSPSAVVTILERRARMHAESLAGACAELERVQRERDELAAENAELRRRLDGAQR